jgi:hypothetical protein
VVVEVEGLGLQTLVEAREVQEAVEALTILG